MASLDYILIVSIFVLYYLMVLVFEKKIMEDPKDIIEKFLAILLGYAGVSLIFFSITGRPFLGGEISEYYVYIFIIGFISVLWAIPNLLSEFKFFRNFQKKGKVKKKK